MLPTEFGKSAMYQLIPKVLFHMGSTANATSKTTVAFCWFTKRRTRIAFLVLPLKLTHLRTKQEDNQWSVPAILLFTKDADYENEKCLKPGAIIRDGDRKRAPFLVLGLAP